MPVRKVDVIRASLMIFWFAALPARAADATPPLDIKPGFWDVLLTVQTIVPPPLAPEVLAKLAPEERARIAAQERAAARPQQTFKRCCLAAQELQQQLVRTVIGEVQGCQQTVLSASRSVREIHVDCPEGLPHRSGVFRIEAADPDKVEVTSNWDTTDAFRTTKTNSTATLWWLGAICVSDTAAPEAAAPAPAEPGALAPKAADPQATPPLAAAGISADPAYYYKLGREQAGRNDFQEALRSLNRAIELDPQRATSYNARGYVYLRLQNYSLAIADFSDAIRLRPDYANAYQNRAVARRHSGDQEGAESDSRRGAELERRP